SQGAQQAERVHWVVPFQCLNRRFVLNRKWQPQIDRPPFFVEDGTHQFLPERIIECRPPHFGDQKRQLKVFGTVAESATEKLLRSRGQYRPFRDRSRNLRQSAGTGDDGPRGGASGNAPLRIPPGSAQPEDAAGGLLRRRTACPRSVAEKPAGGTE